MERLVVDEEAFAAKQADLQGFFPAYADPCPGSRLVVGDDVTCTAGVVGRVIWGADGPSYCHVYALGYGIDGEDVAVAVHWQQITDRAPLDPQDPNPQQIWPDGARADELA